ncbi:hypothetical protein MKX01_017597 [Papaver californicum]|nr:hypothetical protein MKX01_017597 [Papaver californicum]
MNDNEINDYPPRGYAPQGYALSGKIMLSAIVILFTVVILIVCFHIYARWLLQHHRPQPSNLSRNHRRRRRHRRTHRTHFIFNSNPLPSGDTVFAISRGLDSNVLKSIPIFTYSSTTHNQKNDQNGGGTEDGGDVLECAVCLSEFEENDVGRILPKCKHSFHVECIDMWFHSHSTCPLCRTPVTPETAAATTESSSSSSESATIHELTQIVIDSSSGQDSSTSNQPCTSCRNEGSSSSVSGSSSSSSSVSPLSIEVRKPVEQSNLKSLVEETAGQGLKSPGSRMLSLKRILSRERRMSCMSNSLSFCSYVTDNTIDHDEENQVQVLQVQQQR